MSQDQDEYQPTAESYNYRPSEPAKKKAPPLGVIVIALIFVGLFGYKLYTGFSAHGAATQAVGPNSTNALTQKNAKSAPPSIRSEDMVKSSEELAMLKRKQDLSEASLRDTSTQIAVHTQQMAELREQLSQINQNMQDVQQRLLAVQDYLAREAEHKNKKEKKAALPRYLIQGVLPGRAWLQNASGQTLTITEGEKLPGYGEVIQIDPDRGLVVTEKGMIAQHH